jgi:protein-disulfide isomerase
MVDKQSPAVRECADDPVKQLAALGDRLRINSTPTLFFHSGRRATGLPPPEALEKLLQTESGSVVAAQAAQHPAS